MTGQLKRTALVTGAQQGIGRAVAIALARDGCDLAIHFFDDEAAARDVAGIVEAMGQTATLHQADLSRFPECSRLVDDVAKSHDHVDVLVNNAGIFHRSALADLSLDLWTTTMDLNLRAATFLSQEVIALQRAARRPGAIVNLSSVANFGTANGVHYSASKGGMDAMTRAIALDVSREGIRVNGVAPGMILTAQALEGHSPDELQRLAAQTTPGRMGTAEEVASVVAFLASDAASFINGEVIQVNGGAHMR